MGPAQSCTAVLRFTTWDYAFIVRKRAIDQRPVGGATVPIGQTGVVRAYGQAHLPECVPALAGPLECFNYKWTRQDHGMYGLGTLSRANISRGKPIPIGGHEPQRPN